MTQKDRSLQLLMEEAAKGKPMSDLMVHTMIAIGHGATWTETDLAVRYGQSVTHLSLN